MLEGLLTIVMFLLGFVVVIYLIRAARIIRPFQVGVVERLGRFVGLKRPGFRLIVPFTDNLRLVDLREQVVDVPPQEVITKDNVVVTVDGIIYFQVIDAPKMLYNVADFVYAVVNLAQTSLRNIIGELDLDQTLTSREIINARLREILDEATDKWGVKVTRVELKRIDPPRDVMEAMHRQMKAERDRRATVLEADGFKQSQILKAEGEKQASILSAEGERQARILRAQGEAESVRLIADAEKYKRVAVAEGEMQAIMNIYRGIHEGNPTPDLIAIRYLEALQRIADGQATKIFLPLEMSGIMSAVGAIAELFPKPSSGPKAGNREGLTPPYGQTAPPNVEK